MTPERLRLLYIENLKREVTYGDMIRTRAYKLARVCDRFMPRIKGLKPINVRDYPPEATWVWSDQHFFHKNIIKHCDRPFENIDQMHETMINNFNKVVGTHDLVFWVGDVCFSNTGVMNEILADLYGIHILIIGNHDVEKKNKVRNLDFQETHLLYVIDDPNTPFVLTHYSIAELPLPWINIHGHVHNSPHDKEDSLQHINVSVEALDYMPISLKSLRKIAESYLTSIDET